MFGKSQSIVPAGKDRTYRPAAIHRLHERGQPPAPKRVDRQHFIFGCAKTVNFYRFTLERDSTRNLYKITAFEPVSSARLISGLRADAAEKAAVDLAQVDFTGFVCPGCSSSSDGQFFECCSCGQFMCTGRSKRIFGIGLYYRCVEFCSGQGFAKDQLKSLRTQKQAERADVAEGAAPASPVSISQTPAPRNARALPPPSNNLMLRG